MTLTSISELRRILSDYRTIAVVGLSPQWHRPSHFVGKYLMEHGYRVVPINPACQEILGQASYPDLASAAKVQRIDMVDCFRKSADILPLAEQAIAIQARCLWMQLGVVNEAAAAMARAAGLDVVMDRCVKIEHARLFGGLGWAGVNTAVISSKRPQQLPY